MSWEVIIAQGTSNAKFDDGNHLAYIDAKGELFDLQAVKAGSAELRAHNLTASEVDALLQQRGLDPKSALWS